MTKHDYVITVSADLPVGELAKLFANLGIELRACQDGTYYAQPTRYRARLPVLRKRDQSEERDPTPGACPKRWSDYNSWHCQTSDKFLPTDTKE